MISGLVVALNYDDYRNWCKQNTRCTCDYKYISRYEDLCGFHNLPIFLTDGYLISPMYSLTMRMLPYLQD
jgi:hypothetical protein